MKIHFWGLNLRWEGGDGGELSGELEKVITFVKTMSKKGRHCSCIGKNTVTPSVAASNDTDVSDAAASTMDFFRRPIPWNSPP